MRCHVEDTTTPTTKKATITIEVPIITRVRIKWIIIDYWCLNWVHLVIKMPNLENLEFSYMYTVGPQCKIFNYGLQEELMGANDCILVGINETK